MSAAAGILARTREIQKATRNARARTGLNIGVRVKQGRGQVVEYRPIGEEIVELSGWVPLAEVPAMLEGL